MALFTPPGVVTDPIVLKANAIAVMEELLPGWQRKDASVVDAIFDAFKWPAAEQAEVLSEALDSGVYRGLGTLIGVAPHEAEPASALATITFRDTAGHTIPEGGLVVALHNANGELVAFRIPTAVTVAPGSSTLAVTMEAEEGGEHANGLSGLALLVTAPESVLSVSLASSGGGSEAESDQEYLDRLTESLALQRPAPVTAADAAAIARNVPGIGRAAAVDNLKPSAADGGEGSEETAVEKTVTIAVTDAAGVGSDSTHRAAVKALLEELREVNFQFFVVAPRTMAVDVKATVFAWPSQDPLAVKAAAEEALLTGLSPATFATDLSGLPSRWSGDSTLRLATLYSIIGNVSGVRWATNISFGKHGSALGTADLALGGGSAVPALPIPTTLTITVEGT